LDFDHDLIMSAEAMEAGIDDHVWDLEKAIMMAETNA